MKYKYPKVVWVQTRPDQWVSVVGTYSDVLRCEPSGQDHGAWTASFNGNDLYSDDEALGWGFADAAIAKKAAVKFLQTKIYCRVQNAREYIKEYTVAE